MVYNFDARFLCKFVQYAKFDVEESKGRESLVLQATSIHNIKVTEMMYSNYSTVYARMASPNNDISIDVSSLLKGGPGKEGGAGGSISIGSSNGGGQQRNSSSHDDPWLSSIMEEDRGFEEENKSDKSQHPKIQQVSPMLRNVESNKKCFDPMVVSIGPYHHGKPELEFMQSLKMEIARQHVIQSKVPIQRLYDVVVAVAGDARKWYSEGSTSNWDDRQFSQMMFLDGCFILQLIRCFSLDKKEHNIKGYNVAFVRRDLFLLENQLPFLMLEALMAEQDKNEWLKMIDCFFDKTTILCPCPRDHQECCGWLDGIMKIFFKYNIRNCREIINPPADHDQTKDQQQQPVQAGHLLGILHGQLINQRALHALSSPSSEWSSYRSAIELKAAGIKFKPSKTGRFSDVSFEPCGTLRLPPIIVDDSTKSMFLNLVAYEACPGFSDDSGVTAYLSFMDVLIDHAEDVKELRSNGILLNFLGSDKEVADLFNEIGRDLVPNRQIYSKLMGDIERHYHNKAKIWIAEWLHTHFSSPWTFLAFLGAIFVLILQCVQTYFAVYGD